MLNPSFSPYQVDRRSGTITLPTYPEVDWAVAPHLPEVTLMVDVDAEGEDDDEFQQTLEGGLDGAAFDGQGASLSTGCAGSELQKKRAAKALDGGQLGTGQGTVPRKKARKVAATYRGENELSDRGPEAAQPAATVSVLEAESSLLGEHFHGIPFAFPLHSLLHSLCFPFPFRHRATKSAASNGSL